MWADTAYCSAKNEEHLVRNGLRSQIHCTKPKGKPMPEAVARANGPENRIGGKIFHHLRSNVLVELETPGSLRFGHPAFSNEPTASILNSRLCFPLCICHLRLHETAKLGVQRNRKQFTVGLINA